MKKIICLCGAPSSGKSTSAARLFSKVKELGFNAEMNREYIKDWIWEGRQAHEGDQTYFFAKAARKERNLMRSGVELIITDSPLILTHFYGMLTDRYERQFNTSLAMLTQHHAICKDMNYKVDHHMILAGDRPYNPVGRFHTAEEARDCEGQIIQLLNDQSIKHEAYNEETIISNLLIERGADRS